MLCVCQIKKLPGNSWKVYVGQSKYYNQAPQLCASIILYNIEKL